MSDLTVIITASTVPSHPSICLIQETIESLRYISSDQNFQILLAHDFSDIPSYNEYMQNLKKYTLSDHRISIHIRATHGYLVGNIKNVMGLVNTKYLLMIQHDLPFVRKFEILKIIEDMESNPQIKHLRFNQRHNLKLGWDADSDIFGTQLIAKNYTYTRTPAWSDQNHLCLTSYYTDIVMKEIGKAKAMEEALRRKPSTEDGHAKYGTFLFDQYGAAPSIKHRNGRKFILNNTSNI